MFHSKRTKRIGALTLSTVMALACALPAAAAGDGVAPSYDEAYYGTLDWYGGLVEGSVVKSYILNGASRVVDYGSYDAVTNLTNSVTPALAAAGKTSFDFGAASPSHFYFQGSTAKPYEEAPWTLSLTYRLNGVPAAAEALAGATGIVEIDVDAVPNPKAGAYARRNYTLEAMALFNQDDILSLEAPGAQVQLVGNLRTVLFLALPGQTERFEIRVGAEDFSFDGMTFLMVPATLGQLEQVAELARNKAEIEDNYQKLSGSLDTLLNSLDTVSADLVAAAGGLDALNGARATVSAGKGNVYDRADVLRGDLDAVNEALAPVTDELATASEALTEANATVRALTEKTTDLRTDLDALKTTLNDVHGDKAALLQVIDDLDGMQSQLASLQSALNRAGYNPGISFTNMNKTVSGFSQGKELFAAYQTFTAGISAIQSNTSLNDTEKAAAAAAAVQTTVTSILKSQGLSDEQISGLLTANTSAIDAAAIAAMAGSFSGFCSTLAALAGEGEMADQLNKLAALYTDDASAMRFLMDSSEDLGAATSEIERDINNAVVSASYTIGNLTDPTARLVAKLGVLCGDIGRLKPLIESADDLASLAAADAGKIKSILDEIEDLQGVLDTYEPAARETLRTMDGLISATRDALTHTGEFSDALENLMRSSGAQLDAATARSLSALASSLRGVASSLDATRDVRAAKDVVTGLIEDTWEEHTGEYDTLLLMDATAEPVSLTDARNAAPASVQIMLRTQEIKASSSNAAAADSGAALLSADAAASGDSGNFWTRLGRMFSDIWTAITGLVHIGPKGE